MAYTNKQQFLFTLALICCVGLISQVLPPQICLTCAALFRREGSCFSSSPSFVCRLLAFKLLFEVDGEPLCNQRPCEGYDQAPISSCSSIIGCPPARVDPFGICEGFQVCCLNAALSDDTRSLPMNTDK